MRRLVTLGRRGDTIIEVLFAIVIVGVVLGGAFMSADRSLKGTMMSKERTEALKYTQEQLEMLKAAMPDRTKSDVINAPATGDRFCIGPDGAVVPDETSIDGTWEPKCTRGPDGRYMMFIEKSVTNPNEFTARAEWDRIGGGERQHVTIVYRASSL